MSLCTEKLAWLENTVPLFSPRRDDIKKIRVASFPSQGAGAIVFLGGETPMGIDMALATESSAGSNSGD